MPGLSGLRGTGMRLWPALAGTILLLGCTSDVPSSKTPSAQGTQAGPSISSPATASSPEQDGIIIEVLRGTARLAAFSMADIQRLPQSSVVARGKEQAGPTLRSVLAAAGIQEFARVTVYGMRPGRLVSGELTLTKTEVTDAVVLEINRRGSTKLASPSIPSEKWIIDVKRIVVE